MRRHSGCCALPGCRSAVFLVISGCAPQGFVFRHADGSAYGQIAAPNRADLCAKVFQALKNLGFKETESRRAIDTAAAHVGVDASVETLLRAALARLGERTLRVSDAARPSYFVGADCSVRAPTCSGRKRTRPLNQCLARWRRSMISPVALPSLLPFGKTSR
jgi:hypothetical protein